MKLKNLTGTLTGRLIILLFTVSFIPTFISLIYIYNQSKNTVINSFYNDLNNEFDLIKSSFIENPNIITLAKLLSTDDELKIKIFLKLKNQIINRVEYFFKENQLDIIRVADITGNYYAYFNKYKINSSKLPEYFLDSIKDKVIFKIEKFNQLYFYTISVPIKDINSNLIMGIMTISYKIDDSFIKKFDIQNIERASKNIILLVADNKIIATDIESDLKSKLDFNRKDFGLNDYVYVRYDLTEFVNKLINNATFFYGINNKILKNNLKNLIIKFYCLLFILMTVLYFSAYLIGKSFSAPFRDLIKATELISKGDMSIRFEVNRKDEIGHVYNSFNYMLNSIQNYQERLVNTARLASIGQIAAGVSHEINNPLVTILGYSQLLIELISKDKIEKNKFLNYLKIIESDAKRSKNIISNLLDFSRQKPALKIDLNLNLIIINSLQLIKHRLKKENIKIILKLFYKINLLKGDPEQIKQIIFNLIYNSIDAIKNKKGYITIQTFNLNNQIGLEICDNGEGIKKENLPYIFEPFFTTKEAGSGTGLGLSITKNIVELHNGKIMVQSSEGVGTKFTILFRCV